MGDEGKAVGFPRLTALLSEPPPDVQSLMTPARFIFCMRRAPTEKPPRGGLSEIQLICAAVATDRHPGH
jgi:hypothetical protein